MPPIPASASTANQTIMIGPNRLPTRPVPKRWAANSTPRITVAMGSTRCASGGARRAAALPQQPAHERDEGHDAALAVVVRPHHDPDVLLGHDERDRPEHQ